MIRYFLSTAVLLTVFLWSSDTFASAANYKTGYRYNLGGQLTGTISPDPDGTGPLTFLAQRQTYNNQGLLRLVEYGALSSWPLESVAPASWSGFTLHRSVRYDYDLYGRQSAVIQQNKHGNAVTITQTRYDSLDRTDCAMVRMSTTLATDACVAQNHGDTITPVWDRVTKYSYNNNDSITTVQKGFGSGVQQTYSHTIYHFKDDGTETTLAHTLTDANNNTTRYEYDDLNRLTHWYFPFITKGAGVDNASDYEQYGYDNNGNRTSLRKRDGRVISYQYDGLNQLTRKDIPNIVSKDVYYQYNNLGLQTAARFAGHSGAGILHTYSGFAELKTEQITQGTSRTLTYSYDKNSNRRLMVYPDNSNVSYEYDGLDRQTVIKEQSATVIIQNSWRAEGTPYELTRNNNQNNVTRYGYDDLNRLTDLDWLQNSATFNARDFAYNRASQVQSVTTSNHDVLYKGNHNLKGNWVSNGLNQYSSINGVTHNYDLNGNLTGDGSTTYVYDAENRLTSATGAKNLTLTYDPLGRLHTTTAAATGITTTYLYSGDALIAEYVGTTMTKRYVHGNGIDNPLVEYHGSTISSANRYYLHSDHQGSITGISNSAGTVTALNTYDSFGIPHQTNQGRFSYTGQIYLPELEMYHYKARVYHPKLGRFLQTDPVGYEDQMNIYAYVGNDPMNYIDPMGMETMTSCGSADDMGCRTDHYPDQSSGSDIFQSPGSTLTGEAARNQVNSWQNGGTYSAYKSFFDDVVFNKNMNVCRAICYDSVYGESYHIAKDIAEPIVPTFLGKEILSGLIEELEKKANLNLYEGSRTRNFKPGRRMLKTLKVAKASAATMVVIQAGARGYVWGANGVCSVKCTSN